MSPNIKTYSFPNGFKVIYEKPLQNINITSINVFCKVGSAYETDSVRGASHFVEHMCFKGTHRIQKSKEIFSNYDKIGAYLNAYTEKINTCYTVKCIDEYAKTSIEVLSDMMMNSTFPKPEFIKEQKVMVEENMRNENDSTWILSEMMDKVIYAGSSFAYPVDSIQYHPTDITLQYNDLLKWYSWFYHSENMVFSIATHIPFEKIIDILKTCYFTSTKKSLDYCKPRIALEYPNSNLSPIPTLNAFPIHIILNKKKGFSTNTIAISFRTCHRKSPDRHSLNVLQQILSMLSGRLFTILREKNGLTYKSFCETEYYSHTGKLSIHAETDSEKTLKNGNSLGVLPLMIHLLRDLKQNGIQLEELKRAKGYLKGKNRMALENIDNLTEYNGMAYMLSETDSQFKKEFIPYMELYDKYYHNITLDDIQRVIAEYFCVENMAIGIMGEKIPSRKQIEDVCRDFIHMKK